MKSDQTKKTLDLWAEVFGRSRVIVRPYARDTYSQWNIITDFLSVFDLHIEARHERFDNRMLSIEGLFCLNAFNRHYRHQHDIDIHEAIDTSRLAGLIERWLPSLPSDKHMLINDLISDSTIDIAKKKIQEIVDMRVGIETTDFPGCKRSGDGTPAAQMRA